MKEREGNVRMSGFARDSKWSSCFSDEIFGDVLDLQND